MAPEISRRISSILDDVEEEASRLREEARSEAIRYTDSARRHADELVAERQRRIAELSDELIVKSEAVASRLADAAPVRQGFENLVRALGHVAERLSIEAETDSANFTPPSFHEAARQPPPQRVPTPSGYPNRRHAPMHNPPQPPPDPSRADTSDFAEQPQPSEVPYQPAWRPPAAPGAAGPSMPAKPAARVATWQEREDARMIAVQLAGAGNTRAEVRDHLDRVLGIVDAEQTLDEIFGRDTGEDARVPWTTGDR